MISKTTFQYLTQKRGFVVCLAADADGPEVRMTIQFKGRTIRMLRAVTFMTVEFPKAFKELRGIKFYVSYDHADEGEDNTDIILRDDALLMHPEYITLGLTSFAIETFVDDFSGVLKEGNPRPEELKAEIGSALMRIMRECFGLLEKADNAAVVRKALEHYFPDVPALSSKFADIQKVFAGGVCSPK